MKDKLIKVRKRHINWREVIFHLHNFDVSRDFDLFRAKHPKMSINRCAYNVLKTYCSTASMVWMRKYYKFTNLSEKEVVEWFLFNLRSGDLPQGSYYL